MASAYEFQGKIVWVGEVESFPSGFRKRTFVLCPNPDDKYPDTIAFELTTSKKRDMTNDITTQDEGLEAKVKFYCSSRRYDNDKIGKTQWFTGNRAVEVEVARPAESPKAAAPAQEDVQQGKVEGDPDGLPF